MKGWTTGGCAGGSRVHAAMLVVALLLGSWDPSATVADTDVGLRVTYRDALRDSLISFRPNSFLGPRGDCHGKVFFLYPIFKRLQLDADGRVIAFRGIEGVGSLIVLVSRQPFLFEMHGRQYQPDVGRIPLPKTAYVLVEWDAAAGFERAFKLVRPTRGFPIPSPHAAHIVADQHVAVGDCRIVELGGYVDADEAVERSGTAGDPLLYGSNVTVEPSTELILISPTGLFAGTREATTVWLSIFAAWQYEPEAQPVSD